MKTSIWDRNDRLAGLRRFAIAITILNILGHFVLGFEQSWIQPLVGLSAAYATEILLEWIDAALNRRRPRFLGGARVWIDFLLSAHISGLACSMLIYTNDQVWPVAFAASAVIASKALIRTQVGKGERHVFNPSNLAITVTPHIVRPARPGDLIKAPTDDTRPPNDVDYFLMSKTELSREPRARSAPTLAASDAKLAAASSAAPSGHMLDMPKWISNAAVQ